MGRKCTICTHPKRKEIDELLVSGEQSKIIARRYDISEKALSRHKNDHLLIRSPPSEVIETVIAPITPKVKVYNPKVKVYKPKPINGMDLEKLFVKIELLVDESFKLVKDYQLIAEAMTPNDVKAKATAINSLRGTLEFISKLFGLVSSDGTSPGLLKLQTEHEKMKQFILNEVCDDCRVRLIQRLENQSE